MTTTATTPTRAEATGASETAALLLLSETTLLLAHLAVVGGFARLYEDGSFFAPLAGFVVGAHLLAVVLRRRRVAGPVVTLLALVGGALAASWLVFASSTMFGVPTSETWQQARIALVQARQDFSEVIAPAPVTAGFQLAAGLALYGAVWFADWAAFRLRTTIEAVVPSAVLFTFAALLGSGSHQVSSTVAYAAAVLLFVLCHRALRAEADHAWLTASSWSGPRAVLRAGVSLAAVGLLAGVVVGPRLPGNGAEALVTWRASSRPSGDRSTVSPIVDLQKRLVNQSDTVLFRVRAERAAYWRLTSLDRFDGRLWSSGGEYSPADGPLPSDAPPVPESRRNRQQVEIRSLSAIWAPAAYQTKRLVSSSSGLRWDPDSSTLIVDTAANSDGLDYEVVSDIPDVDPAVLAGASNIAADDDIDEGSTDLPADFPEVAARTASDVTADATGRYEAALALQGFFRDSFTYSLEVEPGHGDDALVTFLDSRRGYCEQFAGAYAAMARSLGIPARVAVGFTPGERDPEDPTLFTVRGRHAHAWPEVFFPETGWVAFEPTPGRGMPDAEDYTGVAEQQDLSTGQEQPGAATTTTTTPPAATTTPGSATTAPAPSVPRDQGVATGSPTDDGSGPSTLDRARTVGLLAIGAILLWLAVVLAAPALRRRRSPERAASQVLDAWADALDPVRWLVGARPAPAETHQEFADRVAAMDPTLGGPVTELAGLATAAAWDPTAPTAAMADRSDELDGQLHDEARRRQRRSTRLRRRLSWREAFGRLRPEPVH